MTIQYMHVDVKLYFVQETIEESEVRLVKIHTDGNMVDMATQLISLIKFMRCQILVQVPM